MFVLILLACGGVYSLYKNPEVWIELQLIGKNLKNPEADAKADLENGKVLCYSINGFGPYFPGVSKNEFHNVCSKAKKINFTGTSDAVESLEHGKAISKAGEYAERYNRFVVKNAPNNI